MHDDNALAEYSLHRIMRQKKVIVASAHKSGGVFQSSSVSSVTIHQSLFRLSSNQPTDNDGTEENPPHGLCRLPCSHQRTRRPVQEGPDQARPHESFRWDAERIWNTTT
jgi:hypothetical protein